MAEIRQTRKILLTVLNSGHLERYTLRPKRQVVLKVSTDNKIFYL